MNNRLSLEIGQTHARVRLEKSPHIRNADALEMDWADVLAPTGDRFPSERVIGFRRNG